MTEPEDPELGNQDEANLSATLQMSVSDIPEADRFLKCALPVLITSPAAPEYPGVNGTCFMFRWRNRVAFLTAAHVIKEPTEAILEIPLGFGADRTTCKISRVLSPILAGTAGEDACDLAIMIPVEEPRIVEGQSFALDISEVADMRVVRPHALFAYAGYPLGRPDRNAVDYDIQRIDFEIFHGLGTYVGASPSMAGCHTLKIETEPPGGPNGLSGSPVLRVVHSRGTDWRAGLAGLVIRGGRGLLQFIDAAHIRTFVEDVFVLPLGGHSAQSAE
jgi:hypothetical protein